MSESSPWRVLRDAVWARARQGHLSAPQLLVALRLIEHWPDIYPGEKTLAGWTQLGESTVRRALKDLGDMKVIRILANPGRVNTYEFLDPMGNPIKQAFPDVGPWPVPGNPARSEHPPRSERAPTPLGASAPTPLGASAEADPDPKQGSKQEVKAGPAPTRFPDPVTPGARPGGLYEFSETWKPKQSHRAYGLELGLTDAEMLERAEHCRLKLYERPFPNEDKQFKRELLWLKNDKETKRFREERKANPHGRDESPGSKRGDRDPKPSPIFGRLSPR